MSAKSFTQLASKLCHFKLAPSDSSGNTAKVLLPCLQLADLNRCANMDICSLQNTFTACRMYAYHEKDPKTDKSFLAYDEMTSQNFTFMASTKTCISQDYYNLCSRPGISNLCVDIKLGHVGGASLNTVASLRDLNNDDKILATNVNTVVCVSKQTRAPTLLPQWWTEKYSAQADGEKLKVESLTVPDNFYEYHRTVNWCDTDGYKHTNYVSYLRYCYDAAMDAVQAGFYTNFHEDILKYNTKQYTMLYKAESLGGQTLMCRTWEDTSDPNILYFDFTRAGKLIYQSSIEFYAS